MNNISISQPGWLKKGSVFLLFFIFVIGPTVDVLVDALAAVLSIGGQRFDSVRIDPVGRGRGSENRWRNGKRSTGVGFKTDHALCV